jgi:hypothetical protein
MTVLYIIGAALSAAMWLGLIYVMVVEPTRLYLRKRAVRPADPRFTSIELGPSRLGQSGRTY